MSWLEDKSRRDNDARREIPGGIWPVRKLCARLRVTRFCSAAMAAAGIWPERRLEGSESVWSSDSRES